MEYISIAFDPPVNRNNTTEQLASDLQRVITEQASKGWEFVGLQNHGTVVPGSRGCFGFGRADPYERTISLAVFRK